MNGVIVLSVTSGASLYTKLYGSGFGLIGKENTGQTKACAALGIGGTEHDMTPSGNSALKSITLGEHVMHFAADSKAGIMACVSFMQPLQTTVAAKFTQKVLSCFLEQYGTSLAGEVAFRQIKGFGRCFDRLCQDLPQQIVASMAEAVKPMPMPWVLLTTPRILSQFEATLHAVSVSKWRSCLDKARVLPDVIRPFCQLIPTDPSQAILNFTNLSCVVPGTSHTANDLLKVVANASRQLATSASDPSSPTHSLPSYLHSLDLPFHAAQLEPVLVAAASVPDVASDPACTPRMIEILPKEGRATQSQQTHDTGNANHRLLVLYHKTAVIAMPLQLAANTVQSATQARNAVVHGVNSLIAFSDLESL